MKWSSSSLQYCLNAIPWEDRVLSATFTNANNARIGDLVAQVCQTGGGAEISRDFVNWLLTTLLRSGQGNIVVHHVVRNPHIFQAIGMHLLLDLVARVKLTETSRPLIHAWLDQFILTHDNNYLALGIPALVDRANAIGDLLCNQPQKFSNDHLRKLALYPSSFSYSERGTRDVRHLDPDGCYTNGLGYNDTTEETYEERTVCTPVPENAKNELRCRGVLPD